MYKSNASGAKFKLEQKFPVAGVTRFELQSDDPWLTEFDEIIGGFEKSYEIFLKEPKLVSKALSGYVGLLYHEMFDEIRKEELRARNERNAENGSGEEIYLDYDLISEKVQSHPRWNLIKKRVKQFAELADCPVSPEADRNAFSYLDAIQRKSYQIASSEQESKLQATIALLKEENREQSQKLREQDRILSCLAFRHILERLPHHRTKNEANNWMEFWEKAVKEANKPGGRVTPVTPIIKSHGIFEQGPSQPANITQIKNVGSALYNTLSTNIHHFTGEYKLGRDQWDVLPRKILEAIVPQKTNDGTVNWEEERDRFISPPPTVPSNPVPNAPSASVPDSGSALATSSATASAGPVSPPTPTA